MTSGPSLGPRSWKSTEMERICLEMAKFFEQPLRNFAMRDIIEYRLIIAWIFIHINSPIYTDYLNNAFCYFITAS